jgi:hypothetical protein
MAFDFEQWWLGKFRRAVEQAGGTALAEAVLQGSDTLSDETPREKVIQWSQAAIDTLHRHVTAEQIQQIFLQCACHFPAEQLDAIARQYQQDGSLEAAHAQLQQGFEKLMTHLGLDDEQKQRVRDAGMGAAGEITSDDRIIATKIPKSGFLLQWLQEPDEAKRRELYCHCPRVRDAMKLGLPLSDDYCYCGAGFYQDIWQRILGKTVEIRVTKSILRGDEVCQFELKVE